MTYHPEGTRAFAAEPGGKRITGKVIGAMIRQKMIVERDAGLLDGTAQTMRLTDWWR